MLSTFKESTRTLPTNQDPHTECTSHTPLRLGEGRRELFEVDLFFVIVVKACITYVHCNKTAKTLAILVL